ncbi:MAG: glycosyltransferase [Candidatus Krumholzibacteriota bacterium]|nr:glycosyltransferase [Candidatus Krumholzibacteriota bacterium]
MKILIAVPYSPYPVRRGFDRLMMNLIEGLLVNNKIILVTMTFSESERDLLKGIEKDGLKIRSITAPNKRSIFKKIQYKIMNAIRLAAKGIPPEVSYASPVEFLDLIAETAADETPDLIFSSYWHLYRLPLLLPGFRNILLTLDLDYLAAPSRLLRVKGWGRRFIASLMAGLNGKIEKEAYARFKTILTVTDKDTQILKREYVDRKKQISTLPISLDLEEFSGKGRSRAKDRLLITGTHISDFNRDALRYFILDVMPELRKRRPSVYLVVTGSILAEDRAFLSGADIEYTGYVEDLAACLAEAAVMVLPLRFGGGIRIRMLEAAAAGTPVVSTPKGVEGMGLTSGKEYLEAESPHEMADSIIRLLDDPVLAGSIGRNARAWVEKHYSRADYPERLEALLRDIMS